MKWTKKDLATLTGMLDSWWLCNRPSSDSFDSVARLREARAKADALLADPRNRLEIILAGIRSWEQLESRRYREACEVIGNAIARPLVWGDSSAEMIERFAGLAREHDKVNTIATALRVRVQAEELPPEVLAHDPARVR